jgi:phenylacetate-coenzyme A ligase PaaK-like adenylate-forming protein
MEEFTAGRRRLGREQPGILKVSGIAGIAAARPLSAGRPRLAFGTAMETLTNGSAHGDGALPPATGDYEADRQRHVEARRARVASEVELLTWPLPRLWALRDERLRRLLRHARERSPWHAERLAGVDVDTVSGADLAAIPPMTKADLMAHWDRIVTDPRLSLERVEAHLERVAAGGPAYLLDEYHAVASGGSSGRRAVVVWDFEGFLHHHLAYARVGLWRKRRERPPDPRPTVVAAVYATNPVHVSAALARCFSTDRYQAHLLSAGRPLGELVAALNALEPTNLATYPSVLAQLARRARAGGLSIRPRRITTHGEPLPSELRAEAEAVWGVPAESSWGTTETAPLAHSDGVHPWLVVCEDKTVIEPVDAAGRPVPPGERAAKVLVTNVVNGVLPLIRYEVEDEVTFLDQPNPGPWTGRLLEGVHGRTDEAFTYGGELAVHPFTFRAVLGEAAAVAEYQVLQTERGAEVLAVAASEADLADLGRRLAAALAAAGLAEPRVAVRRVDQIERHRETGKLRRFVPLR